MIKKYCDVCEKEITKFEYLFSYIRESFDFNFVTNQIVCKKCQNELCKVIEKRIKELKGEKEQ